MTRKSLFFGMIIITFFSICVLEAQTLDDFKDETAQAVIAGVETIAGKMISTSFTPMTGYGKGDLRITGALGGSSIQQVYADPLVTGKNLTGISFGGGGGYALTDRFLVYSLLGGLVITGEGESDLLGDGYGDVALAVDCKTLNLFAGLGYEAVATSRFSLPVFLGFHTSLSSYQARVNEKVLPLAEIEGTISGGGVSPGLSGGIAGEFHMGAFSLGGYYIYMLNFLGIEGQADFALDSIIHITHKESYTIDPYFGGTYGLSFGLPPKDKWSFGVNLSDFLPLPDHAKSGVEMVTVALFASYDG